MEEVQSEAEEESTDLALRVKTALQQCLKQVTKGRKYPNKLRGCMICELSDYLDNSQRNESYTVVTKNLLKTTEVVNAFSKIYDTHGWGTDGGGSGNGSSKKNAADGRHWLEAFVFNHRIRTFVDAPCGAVHSSWTKDFIHAMRTQIPCFRYHGYDAVRNVVKQNAEDFLYDVDFVTFTHADLSSSDLLIDRADLILSRDALQHLSMKTTASVLINYCRSQSTYLAVGSYLEEKDINGDISDGGYYHINVLADPFNFPAPFDIYAESPQEGAPEKFLLIYQLANLCTSSGYIKFVNKYQNS